MEKQRLQNTTEAPGPDEDPLNAGVGQEAHILDTNWSIVTDRSNGPITSTRIIFPGLLSIVPLLRRAPEVPSDGLLFEK